MKELVQISPEIQPLFDDLGLSFKPFFIDVRSWMDLGLILVNKDRLATQKIPDNVMKITPEQLLQAENCWITTTVLQELQVTRPFLLLGAVTLEKIGVSLIGPVYLGEGTVVARSAILGPVVIAENVRIHDSGIRGGTTQSQDFTRVCFIEAGAQIWDRATVRGSYIGPNTKIRASNINDSLIGQGVEIGGDVGIANRGFNKDVKIYQPSSRQAVTIKGKFGTLIGDQAYIGAKTILLPGTVIGRNSRIMTSDPVLGYLPPNSIMIRYLLITPEGAQQVERSSL